MSQRTRFLGLDAHAKTIDVAVEEQTGQPEAYGEILTYVRSLATPSVDVRALADDVGVPPGPLHV